MCRKNKNSEELRGQESRIPSISSDVPNRHLQVLSLFTNVDKETVPVFPFEIIEKFSYPGNDRAKLSHRSTLPIPLNKIEPPYEERQYFCYEACTSSPG